MAPSSTADSDACLTIEQALELKVLEQRSLVKRLRRDHGHKIIGTCTVNQAYGGMRHSTAMTYETSDVNPYHGVRIRDIPLTDCYNALPCPTGASQPYVEAMLWLLLTGDIPSETQVKRFQQQLADLSLVPDAVFHIVDTMPSSAHPMIVLASAMLAMQAQSRQAVSLRPRDELWRDTLHDALAVIVQQTVVAAYIYQTRCKKTKPMGWRPEILLPRLDLAANMAQMMGFDDTVTDDLFRLHLATHMDHGGGSASCLGVRVVGSTHADAFRAWAAGLAGLSGPRHGQAAESSLRFVLQLREHLAGRPPLPHLVREFVWLMLHTGSVIPGYGHTTLLATDPRFHMQREFAKKHMPEDELCVLASALFEVVPDILQQHGRARNPWPNVDAHSGVLLYNRGLHEIEFHTVMFAASRVMGPISNLVWDRALCLPIVRPMSVTTRWINAKFERDVDYVPPGLPEL